MKYNKTILSAVATALLTTANVTNAATVFQIDFQSSGSPAGQESQSGWTAWNVTGGVGTASINSTVGGIGVTVAALGTGAYFDPRGGTAVSRGGEITGTSWDDMVEDLLAARNGTGAGAGDMSIALTGLTAGLTYTLTGWHNDSYTLNEGFAANTGYAVTPSITLGSLVDTPNAGASTNVRAGARSDANFNTSVISFTSDGSGNATIMLTGASSNNYLALNGLQLTAVPEPTTALLGSLGVLALLRRRRA